MMRGLVLGALGFTIGVCSYLAVVDLMEFLRRRRSLRLAHAVSLTGFVLSLGLVFEAVFRAPRLEPEWRTVLFTLAVVMVAGGSVASAWISKRERRES